MVQTNFELSFLFVCLNLSTVCGNCCCYVSMFYVNFNFSYVFEISAECLFNGLVK